MVDLTNNEMKVINQLKNRNSERELKMDCVDCGEEFSMSVGSLCAIYHNGLIVPCRCSSCKQKKDERFKAYEEEVK